MLNECILVGELIDAPAVGRTDTGIMMARARVRVSEHREGSERWYTSVQLIVFGRAVDSTVTLGKGAVVLVRGRLRYSRADGLYVLPRTIEPFDAPAMFATDVDPHANTVDDI